VTYLLLINLSYHLQEALYFCQQKLARDIYGSRYLGASEFLGQMQTHTVKKVGVI